MAYDHRAVKVPKSVKRLADNIVDSHQRGAFIKSYVKILEDNLRSPNKKSKTDNTQGEE